MPSRVTVEGSFVTPRPIRVTVPSNAGKSLSALEFHSEL